MKRRTRSAIGLTPAAIARLIRAVRDDDGSNLVEFALCAVVLFTVMFGIIAFSLVMFCDLMTSEAAREGARYAMVRGNTWSSDCTTPGPANCIAQSADIQSYAKSVVTVNGANLSVVPTWVTPSGTVCGTADSCKLPGNRVKVTATYTFDVLIPLVPRQK